MLTSISRLTGPIALMIAVSIVVATPPAAAQDDEALAFPEGWEVRFDREGASMDDLYLVTMPPGYHVTTGPAMIAWHPDSVAETAEVQGWTAHPAIVTTITRGDEP